MDRLPGEILAMIARHLNPFDVSSLSRTSRTIRAAIVDSADVWDSAAAHLLSSFGTRRHARCRNRHLRAVLIALEYRRAAGVLHDLQQRFRIARSIAIIKKRERTTRREKIAYAQA